MKIEKLQEQDLNLFWATIQLYREAKRLNFLPRVDNRHDLDLWFKSVRSKALYIENVGFVVYQYISWKNVVEFDIFLLPENIGKGLGDEALKTTENFLKKEYPDMIAFVAECVNDYSKKLFSRNGYINDPSHWTKINEFYKLV